MATVTVHFDCSDQSWQFTPNNGTVNVPPGQSSFPIQWNLDGKNKPAGTKVEFAGTGGVAFKSTNPKAWPGTTPTQAVGDPKQYNCTDDNSDPGDNGSYAYGINIVVTDGNGTQTPYSFDPDVQNDSAVCVSHAAYAAV
jgi:hypothetical protein